MSFLFLPAIFLSVSPEQMYSEDRKKKDKNQFPDKSPRVMATRADKDAILIVDDTPTNLEVLVNYLTGSGFEVFVATDGESAIERVALVQPDIILLDVMMPGIDGFETCRRLKQNEKTRDIPVIFMTALTDTVDKVRGFNAGAVDYVTKPFQQEEVRARVTTHLTIRRLQQEVQRANEILEQRVAARTAELQEALEEVKRLQNRLEAENLYLQEEIKLAHNFEEIITQDETLKNELRKIEQVAATDATVLILGETGTGKELLARAVHDRSQRRARPLVKVNCAALPANLIESELFGHEKGAFTGALSRRAGRFELADKGTIFLDEIGDMPAELQAKLLRVLQEGEFERVGGTQTLKVNVRVIAATNRDLAKAAAEGSFRQDLYYRLNVFPISIPPLRERLDDIPILVQHISKKYAAKLGKNIETIPQKVIDAMRSYSWPGNVRELENIVERAVILTRGNALQIDDSFETARSTESETMANGTLQEVERKHILRVLEETKWKIAGKRGAAERLGLNPSTLWSRMHKLGIEKP